MNINLTLLFQVLFFVVFVWFSKKYVWSMLIAALDERKTNIADGLAAAEKGHAAEQEGRAQADGVIADAKAQAAEIVNRASTRADELVEEARQNARSESERITAAARAEIASETNKAREALRAEVGDLALAGAEQILKREIDPKTHAQLLSDLAKKL